MKTKRYYIYIFILFFMFMTSCGSVTLTDIIETPTCETILATASESNLGYAPTACTRFVEDVFPIIQSENCITCHTYKVDPTLNGNLNFDDAYFTFQALAISVATDAALDENNNPTQFRINLTSPGDSLLLTKPLSADSVGTHAHGSTELGEGPQTWTTETTSYTTILSWIQSAKE